MKLYCQPICFIAMGVAWGDCHEICAAAFPWRLAQKRGNSMWNRLLRFLRIPSEIREEFWLDTLQKNRLSLLVICTMIFGMEVYNIVRVLVWSPSGLGTLNNRIYFGMYCALILCAGAYLLLRWLLRDAAIRTQLAIQFGGALFALLWHVCLNAYDLNREPDGDISVYMTAILGVAVFVQMPSAFSFLSLAGAYALFVLLASSCLSNGAILNMTFSTIVAVAIALTRCRNTVIVLSQRREINEINLQLQSLLQKDPLTGLLNKAAFEKKAAVHLAQVERDGGLTMLMADLDDFKDVNDRYGHPCGDYVLKETAEKLQAAFPDAVEIGRIGGDEFAVMLYTGDPAALETDSRRLIEMLSGVEWKGACIGPQCSIGICRISRTGVSYEQLYEKVDRTLYRAKRQGKGRCCVSELA